MQRGTKCNNDQDVTRIKMLRGSLCNEDQDATIEDKDKQLEEQLEHLKDQTNNEAQRIVGPNRARFLLVAAQLASQLAAQFN